MHGHPFYTQNHNLKPIYMILCVTDCIIGPQILYDQMTKSHNLLKL